MADIAHVATQLTRNSLTYLSLGHTTRRGCDSASIQTLCGAVTESVSLITLELSFRYLSANAVRHLVLAASGSRSLRTLRLIANGSLLTRQADSLCQSLGQFAVPSSLLAAPVTPARQCRNTVDRNTHSDHHTSTESAEADGNTSSLDRMVRELGLVVRYSPGASFGKRWKRKLLVLC